MWITRTRTETKITWPTARFFSQVSRRIISSNGVRNVILLTIYNRQQISIKHNQPNLNNFTLKRCHLWSNSGFGWKTPVTAIATVKTKSRKSNFILEQEYYACLVAIRFFVWTRTFKFRMWVWNPGKVHTISNSIMAVNTSLNTGFKNMYGSF